MSRSLADRTFFRQQGLPRTQVRLNAVNSRVQLGRPPDIADPHDAEARLAVGIQNSDDVAGPEFNVQTREERSTQADLAGASLL